MLSRKEFRYLRLYSENGDALNEMYDKEQELYFKDHDRYEKEKADIDKAIERLRRRSRYLDRQLTKAHEEALENGQKETDK